MRLLHVESAGVKGREFAHDLAPVTVFAGRNGIGKSSRLLAVELALRGPRSKDRRYGSGDRVQSAVVLDTEPRLRVIREVAPKHKLAVDGWDKATLKDLQGRLDGLLRLQPAVFDVAEFTGMTDDRKRARLLELAAPVDVAKYADICPDVVPIQGESAAEWLARALAAMKEERLALMAQARRSDVTTVSLTSATRGQFENPEPIRQEIAVIEVRQASARSYAEVTAWINTSEAALAAAQERHAELAARVLPPPVAPDDGAEASARQRMAAAEAEVAARTRATDRRADATRRLQALTSTPAVEPPNVVVDTAALERELATARLEADRVSRLARERAAWQQEAETWSRDMARLARGRLPAQATMVAIRAEVLGGDTASALAKLDGLQALLDESGYPAGMAALQSRKAKAERELAAMGPLPRMPDVASIEAAVRKAKDSNAETERQRKAFADRTAEIARLKAEVDSIVIPGLQDDLAQARAVLERALAQTATRAQAARELAQLQRDQAIAAAALSSAQARVAEAHAALQAHPGDTGDAEQDAARLAELRTSLEGAIQRQAVRETEARLAADAGRQRERIEEVKAIEAKLKDALDEVLRESIAPVADAMEPFCALLGGRFGLGEDSPLGFMRGDLWIPLEAASDSEQAVYGAGLALALAGGATGGLRLVLLDRLDVCDERRAHAVLDLGAQLVIAGRLDSVLATTHVRPLQMHDDVLDIICLS